MRSSFSYFASRSAENTVFKVNYSLSIIDNTGELKEGSTKFLIFGAGFAENRAFMIKYLMSIIDIWKLKGRVTNFLILKPK